MNALAGYREVWTIDFEYRQPRGERPEPHTFVAREHRSGCERVAGYDELRRMSSPPFDCGPDTLVVAFYAGAEAGCFLQLGWKWPACVLDVHAEWCWLINGLVPLRVESENPEERSTRSLLAAAQRLGLAHIAAAEKTEMRVLAMRGPPFTLDEQRALINYCRSDVVTTEAVLRELLRRGIDVDRAPLRGLYGHALAVIEANGIPVDAETFAKLDANWDGLKDHLVRRADERFGVFNGHHLNHRRFGQVVDALGVPWPERESSTSARRTFRVDKDTRHDMLRIAPQLSPIMTALELLGQARRAAPEIGADGRARCMLSPFASVTSRNQPSNSRFMFGMSAWLRSLIKPPVGHSLLYVDYRQQEFGVAAALSGDANMRSAYSSGDPYLAFAVQVGAAPRGATKQTHGVVRELYKRCVLATQYGMQAESLARQLGLHPIEAQTLLRQHRVTYLDFWNYIARVDQTAYERGELVAPLGWRLLVGGQTKRLTVQNWMFQCSGAEMLRVALILLVARGVEVVAPVHDAVAVVCRSAEVDETFAVVRECMEEASRVVLDDLTIGVGLDARVDYPSRFMDPRGQDTWALVQEYLRRDAGVA